MLTQLWTCVRAVTAGQGMRQPLICPASPPLLETVSKQLKDSRRGWSLSVQRALLNSQFNSRGVGWGEIGAPARLFRRGRDADAGLDSARRPGAAAGRSLTALRPAAPAMKTPPRGLQPLRHSPPPNGKPCLGSGGGSPAGRVRPPPSPVG